MRLNSLTLPRFKNLRGLTIEFDKRHSTTLIVGRNGAGKSNLIEALVRIFRDLDRGFKDKYRTPFAFSIDYEIRGDRVRIDHDGESSGKGTIFEVNGKRVPMSKFLDKKSRKYLPETLFAYYSGPSNRLEELFSDTLAEFRDAMIRNEKHVRQHLIYGRLIHSKFVLLSFFGEEDDEARRFLDEQLGIETLESVLFEIKQPYWGGREGVAAKYSYWGAGGVVRRFLDRLKVESLAPLQLDVRVPAGIKRWKSEERVFLYLQDRAALNRLVSSVAEDGDQGAARELFKTLESAYVSDLIADVRINVRKRNVDDTVTFRELSEGEQQLLMVLGLLKFTRDEESLFLLDEPDTHLNPAWSQDYLSLLDRTVSNSGTSQVLLATHDPISISMLEKSQIQQLIIDSDGRTRAEQPEQDPVQQGVAGVLMGELFGLKSLYSPDINKLFEERHRLLVLQKRSPEEDLALEKVNLALREVDLSSATPDPKYAEYLRAMAKIDREAIDQKPALSPEELREQRKLTEAVLRELTKSGDDDAVY
jgi:predicted ATPase